MHALRWVKATKPEKVLGALQHLMIAIDVTRDLYSGQKGKSEVANLAE